MARDEREHTHGASCGAEEHARRSAGGPVYGDLAFERAATLFRTAGDVARLKLLDRLAAGEWCVTELAEAAGVGLSTVSQQLRVLRAERLVERRRAGKHIFYALADGHVIDLIRTALEHASEDSKNERDSPPSRADKPNKAARATQTNGAHMTRKKRP
jgi:DNA-binding transcriptional ArsR family regulator